MEHTIRFYGRVQGVFFRATAKEHAQKLGLKGTVRNCSDGSVELIAHGEEEAIQALIAQLSSHFTLDPENPYSHQKRPPEVTFSSFDIIY